MADRIYIQDIRNVKYCMKGVRKLFERHGQSWTDFLKNGFPIEEAEKYNNAMINKVIENVKKKK